MTLLGLLPLGVLLLAAVTLHRAGLPGRVSLVVATVGWGVFIAASTELLSIVSAFDATGLIIAWLVAAVGIAAYLRQRSVRRLRPRRPKLNAATWIVAAVVMLLAGQLVVSLTAAPGTWDSMTYHLPRVEHWRQQRSVTFYATAEDRQLYSAPWAEYAVAHLRILSGGDRLAALPQWLAAALSAVAVSLIAQRLGGDRQAQAMSVAVAATLPMGVLQATSTQTDYVVSMWIAIAIWALLATLEGTTALLGFVLAASVGLAILTKGTAFFVLAPALLLWAGWRMHNRPKQAAVCVVMSVLAVALLNGPHWARNADRYGAPLGPASGQALVASQRHDPPAVASNVIRNVASNFSFSARPANTATESAVRSAHKALNLSVNDPRTTFTGTKFAVRGNRNEDFVGNPLHLAFSAFAVSLILLLARLRSPIRVVYVVALVGACLLFAGALRWQPWITRLQLPLFVLAAPICGLLLARARPLIIGSLGVGLILPAALLLLVNDNRPLLGEKSVLLSGRTAEYFTQRPGLREPYEDAAALLRHHNVKSVGLVLESDEWEYPLWRLLPDVQLRRARAADYSGAGDVPRLDAVFCGQSQDMCRGRPGWEFKQFGPVAVAIRSRA